MPLHGNGWRPTLVTRFVQAFGTATGTVRVDTDAGEGYLKALGNPEGPHALACELVGSRLADWFGLQTLDFALIQVGEDDDIPLVSGNKALPGPAFISRAENTGFSWSGDDKELNKIDNINDISGLVVLDTWLLNCDRHAPDGRRVNLDNVFLTQHPNNERTLRLMAMDFTHAFTCGGEINRRVGYIEKIKDANVYGCFRQFVPFLNREEVRRLAALLSEFDHNEAKEVVSSVPKAWEVGQENCATWASMITQRAHFLAENIETMLWPQMELIGGTE